MLPSIMTLEKPASIARRHASGVGTVVEVHHDGNIVVVVDGAQQEIPVELVGGEGGCTNNGLHDDRRLGAAGRVEHGLDLLDVGDVECPDSVSTRPGVVESLPKSDEGHCACGLS